MAENIIIKIESDNKGLVDTIALLEKMGKISAKDAEEYRKLAGATKTFAESQNVVQKELTETEKALSATTSQAKKTNAELERPVKSGAAGVKKDISALDSVLKNIGGAIAGAFAVQSVIRFGMESVKAFQEAEKNALLLKSAVSVNGGLQQDFEELIQQSEELQKLTIFSDDAIQQAQTAALQFGLTKDQVKALIPVITDFASATGQDLQTALSAVVAGINGAGKGLKQFGVTIDENGTRQSRLAEITAQLTKTFDGQAKAVGETASGAAAKYANEIDNLQESLGERLAPVLNQIRGVLLETTEALLESVGLIENKFDVFDVKFKKYKDGFKEKFSSTSLEDLRVQYGELVKIQEKVLSTSSSESKTVFLAQKQAIIELLNAANSGTKALTEEGVALAKLADISKLTDAQLKELQKTFGKFNTITADDALDSIEKEFEKRAKERSKKQIDNTKKEADEVARIRKELAEKEFQQDEDNLDKYIAQRKEALVKANLPTEQLEKELTALELFELETRLQNLKDYGKATGDLEKQIADFKVKNYIDANKKIEESNKSMWDAYQQSLKDIAEAEKEAAEKRVQQQKEVADAIVDAVQKSIGLLSEASNNYYNAQADAIEKNKESIIESYDEQIEANERKHDRNLIGDRQYENNKEELIAKQTAAEKKADKELRKIKHDQAVFNKTIALAQAILNTALGVTNAITTGDPYTAALRAAIVAAIGAAEIAVIAAQPIPAYAKGTEMVKGKGHDTSDNIHAMLSPGERIVPAARNRKYFPILSAIHNERFDPESMNMLAKMSPDMIKMIALTDKTMLSDIAKGVPLFKHEMLKPIYLKQGAMAGAVTFSQTAINQPAQTIDEYGVARALDRGTHLKQGTIKELAKEIGKEVKEKKNLGKSWR